MSFLDIVANREKRFGPISLQFLLVIILAVGNVYLLSANIYIAIVIASAIGWYLNSNEVHRLILIPLWIMISLAISAVLYGA